MQVLAEIGWPAVHGNRTEKARVAADYRCPRRCNLMLTEAQIVVLETERPAVCERIFEAAAKHPAPLPVFRVATQRLRPRSTQGIVLRGRDVVVHPCQSAFAVNENAILSARHVARFCRDGSKGVDLRLAGAAECPADKSTRHAGNAVGRLHAGSNAR